MFWLKILWNVSSGVLIYEDVQSDESERTEEDDILISVDVREERTNNEVSSSSEEEECRIKDLEIEENSEGWFYVALCQECQTQMI